MTLDEQQLIIDAAWHGGYYGRAKNFFENCLIPDRGRQKDLWFEHVAKKTRELLDQPVRLRVFLFVAPLVLDEHEVFDMMVTCP
jgi:hypothetical protein